MFTERVKILMMILVAKIKGFTTQKIFQEHKRISFTNLAVRSIDDDKNNDDLYDESFLKNTYTIL